LETKLHDFINMHEYLSNHERNVIRLKQKTEKERNKKARGEIINWLGGK